MDGNGLDVSQPLWMFSCLKLLSVTTSPFKPDNFANSRPLVTVATLLVKLKYVT